MNLKIKERRITILLSNKENIPTVSGDKNTILKFCKSMNFRVFDTTVFIQRKDGEWIDTQKMLLAKSLAVTDSDTYRQLNCNNTYRRLNFYFQHREVIPSTGIYDCGIDPFDYKSAIGTVSFTDSNL